MSPATEFDYVIVGAGSAGCLLANRLSANPDHRVLLVEAGGKVKEGVSKADAEEMKKKLEAAGAKVELK